MSVPASGREDQPLSVVLAGSGIAAAEAALALHELAGERVTITLLAPARKLRVRAMAVAEPFGLGHCDAVPLPEIARAAGAELIADSFKWLDAPERTVHTAGGLELPYDALLLALGARARPAFSHAITLDDRRVDEQIGLLLSDIESGAVRSLAFLVPSPLPWPLPLYELALLTAAWAREHGHQLKLQLVTPEPAPLAVFGGAASRAVAELLERARIETIPSALCGVPSSGIVSVHPGPQTLRVDAVVALPQLFGPPAPGVPSGAHNGFIATDPFGRVRGLQGVYAAGDATDFAVKHGSIAAQQAETAARSIASRAGAPVQPVRFDPRLTAVLFGGERPLVLRARFGGVRGVHSEVEELADGERAAKLATHYLSDYLEARLNAVAGS